MSENGLQAVSHSCACFSQSFGLYLIYISVPSSLGVPLVEKVPRENNGTSLALPTSLTLGSLHGPVTSGHHQSHSEGLLVLSSGPCLPICGYWKAHLASTDTCHPNPLDITTIGVVPRGGYKHPVACHFKKAMSLPRASTLPLRCKSLKRRQHCWNSQNISAHNARLPARPSFHTLLPSASILPQINSSHGSCCSQGPCPSNCKVQPREG